MGRRRADDEKNRRIDEEVRRRVEEGRWGGGKKRGREVEKTEKEKRRRER